MISRESASMLVLVMAVSAVFMSLTRFLIVSYPLKAELLLKKRVWIPMQCFIAFLPACFHLPNLINIKLIKTRTKSRITRNLKIVDAYYPEQMIEYNSK